MIIWPTCDQILHIGLIRTFDVNLALEAGLLGLRLVLGANDAPLVVLIGGTKPFPVVVSFFLFSRGRIGPPVVPLEPPKS